MATRYVKFGSVLTPLRTDSGMVDDQKKPITYCPTCSAKHGAEIYHPIVSATFK